MTDGLAPTTADRRLEAQPEDATTIVETVRTQRLNVFEAGRPVIERGDARTLTIHTDERRYRSWYNRES